MNFKNALKTFAFAVIGLFFFQSCSVDSTVHFNKDMSGSTSSAFDMSEAIEMISAFAGEDEEAKEFIDMLEQGQFPDSIQNSLDSVAQLLTDAGMENFVFKPQKNGMFMSFDFADIDALNGAGVMEQLSEAMGDSEQIPPDFMGMLQNNTAYSWDGKWLTLNMGGAMMDEIMADMANDPDMTKEDMKASMNMMMGMMGGSMKFNQKYTFARKVKEVIAPFPVEQGKRSVEFKMDMSDIMDMAFAEDPEDAKIKIRLK